MARVVVWCWAAGALLLALGACTANPFKSDIATRQVGGMEVMTRNPELDLLVFQDPDDVVKFCMTPETDAVPTTSVGFALSYQGTGASESDSDGAGVLGGRSPSVLITRELMYRACEFSMNYKLDKGEALTLYLKTLEQVGAIAAAERSAGTPPAPGAARQPPHPPVPEKRDD